MEQARRVSAIIKYDNKDISASLMPYVKSISYRDAMSGQADDLQITPEYAAVSVTQVAIAKTTNVSFGGMEVE